MRFCYGKATAGARDGWCVCCKPPPVAVAEAAGALLYYTKERGKKMGKTQISEQAINAAVALYRKLTPERKVTYLAHLRKLVANMPAPAPAARETSFEE